MTTANYRVNDVVLSSSSSLPANTVIFLKLVLIVIYLITSIPLTSGVLQCYKCTTGKPPMYSNEPVRLCSEFDYSQKYVVDCPFSTFCTKKSYSGKISSFLDRINATERDCASQKDVTQKFTNGSWRQEVSIAEPYTEGCSTVDDKGIKTATTIDCYCNSYLCNEGMSTNIRKTSFIIETMAVTIFLCQNLF